MSVRVHIPPVLRGIAGGRRALDAEGATLSDVLESLVLVHPALAWHLFDENGIVRHNILCIHNSDVVRPIDFPTRTIGDDDEVILANALAGG